MERKSSNMSKRVGYIDTIKFFVMFLVICGHLIQNGSIHANLEDWREDKMFLFIYSFHMPLFTLLSGIFFENSLKLTVKDFFSKKLRQLLVPGWTWGLCITLLVFCVSSLGFNCYVSKVSSLVFPYWFLTQLFFCNVVCYFSLKYLSKNKLLAATLTCLLMAFMPYASIMNFNSLLPYFWGEIV